MDLETCVAQTLYKGHAVGEVVSEDCIRYVVGLHVVLELLGHFFDSFPALLICFDFQ